MAAVQRCGPVCLHYHTQERLAGSNNVAALDGVHVAAVHTQRYNVAIGPGRRQAIQLYIITVCMLCIVNTVGRFYCFVGNYHVCANPIGQHPESISK